MILFQKHAMYTNAYWHQVISICIDVLILHKDHPDKSTYVEYY